MLFSNFNEYHQLNIITGSFTSSPTLQWVENAYICNPHTVHYICINYVIAASSWFYSWAYNNLRTNNFKT